LSSIPLPICQVQKNTHILLINHIRLTQNFNQLCGMGKQLKYDLRGVSASKDEVHKAIINLDKGIYPNAFCKILPDVMAGDPDFANIMHADTAGTKTALAYMFWKETGDIDVWKGIAQDALVMNIDDMACVGAVHHIVISNTIGRNKSLVPGEVIQKIIEGTIEFVEAMQAQGINIIHAGGETADVGDIVRTIDVGFTTYARLPRSQVVVNDLKPGNVIIGFASYGMASYETTYNSGIGSNGLTSARHDVFNKHYAENYPEAYDPSIPKEVVFTGSKRMTDKVVGSTMNAGQIVLSPTRTYLPLLKTILEDKSIKVDGIIHNSGGAHSKVLKFIKNVHVVKDKLFTPPPVFKLIQDESGTDLHEMYKVFNMGCRLELYCNEQYAAEVLSIAKSYNIEAKIIGFVESNQGEKVTVKVNNEELVYT